MADYPSKVRDFEIWAKAMVRGARVGNPEWKGNSRSGTGSANTTSALAARPRKKRRRRRRNWLKRRKNAQET